MKFAKWAFCLVAFMCFAACQSGGESKSGSKKLGELKEAKGGKYYGGVFKSNETEYFRSLYPPNITEVGGHRIANQIYEGLVMFDQKDLTVKPALAESWDISADGLTYTFHLRKGVKFHDDPCFPDGKGRELKATDVKYCFDRWCSFDVNNKGYEFIKDRILGSVDYHKATQKGEAPAGGCKGIRVIDDHTVEVKLERPLGFFMNLLSLAFSYIYPEEAVKKYGDDMRIKTVGTGPFIIKTLRENDAVILVRNQDYWGVDADGNQLPYLDALRWSFIAEKKSELLAFKQKKLDFMYRFPLEMVDEMYSNETKQLIGEYKNYQYQESPSMTTQYYGFKNMGDLFNNKKLRQAFNYAVDREKIVRYTVKGAGIAGNYGVVPPAYTGFDAKSIKGFKYNPTKAKQLMAEAGYPNGKGFPEIDLQINSGGGRNEQVAEAIQKMLMDNLNIKLNITKMPFAQHLEACETSKAEFWRAGWVADYPDPENFLNLLYSGHIPPKMTDRSYLNTTRFKNADFDALYDKAMTITDAAERYKVYAEMDKIAAEFGPWLILFYTKDRRLLQSNIRNFPQNPMEYRLLRDVYFVPE